MRSRWGVIAWQSMKWSPRVAAIRHSARRATFEASGRMWNMLSPKKAAPMASP